MVKTLTANTKNEIINEYAKKYGTATYKGLTVALTEQATVANKGTDGDVEYRASAVDKDGNDYLVRWDTVEGWSDHVIGDDGNCAVDGCCGECEDESNACDWDRPVKIERI